MRRRRQQRRTPNVKNPPKIKSKKFVKLTDHTCAYNTLTDFEYKRKFISGNGYICKLAEITSSEFVFGGFLLFGTTMRRRWWRTSQGYKATEKASSQMTCQPSQAFCALPRRRRWWRCTHEAPNAFCTSRKLPFYFGGRLLAPHCCCTTLCTILCSC